MDGKSFERRKTSKSPPRKRCVKRVCSACFDFFYTGCEKCNMCCSPCMTDYGGFCPNCNTVATCSICSNVKPVKCDHNVCANCDCLKCQNYVQSHKLIRCPKCGILIHKYDGCEVLQCSICKTVFLENNCGLVTDLNDEPKREWHPWCNIRFRYFPRTLFFIACLCKILIFEFRFDWCMLMLFEWCIVDEFQHEFRGYYKPCCIIFMMHLLRFFFVGVDCFYFQIPYCCLFIACTLRNAIA